MSSIIAFTALNYFGVRRASRANLAIVAISLAADVRDPRRTIPLATVMHPRVAARTARPANSRSVAGPGPGELAPAIDRAVNSD